MHQPQRRIGFSLMFILVPAIVALVFAAIVTLVVVASLRTLRGDRHDGGIP